MMAGGISMRAAFRLYQIHHSGGQMTVQMRYAAPECGFAAGHHISWMGCLASFAEKGWLDALQYPEPQDRTCPNPGAARCPIRRNSADFLDSLRSRNYGWYFLHLHQTIRAA